MTHLEQTWAPDGQGVSVTVVVKTDRPIIAAVWAVEVQQLIEAAGALVHELAADPKANQ